VIVSAGVVMNIILAAILFFVLFQMGFNVPPAVVGQMQPHSPAQRAGMQIGDEILYFNGKRQHDFTKISLNVALVDPHAEVPIVVRSPDGQERELKITAARQEVEPHGFLMLGINPPYMLAGADPKVVRDLELDPELVSPQLMLIMPGDVVTAVNGQPVNYDTDAHVLDRALQQSYGKPVALTVKDTDGRERVVEIQPTFLPPFGARPLNFAGMEPRPRIERLMPESPGKGKLLPGDVIVAIINRANGDKIDNLTFQKLMKQLGEAGRNDILVDLIVVRNGETVRVEEISPNARLGGGRRGLGVELSYEGERAVVVDVLPDSAAYRAGIPIGATITAIDEQPVESWFDVHRILLHAADDTAVTITAQTPAGQRQYGMTLTAAERQEMANHRYFAPATLAFRERTIERHTSNPFVAAAWGVGETRDLIIQFYLTLRRMVTGDISYKNMMGPVGIFSAGTKFAYRGNDWLIWFLAMISANLAVVNFLPIPIVDGGLFAFLIIEKISGKPISPRMQSVAQVVGLALILSIFLLVTYQDILRIGNF